MFLHNASRRLRVEHHGEDSLAWEILGGHLLDESQTRRRRTFETWHVFASPWPEHATLSVLLDAQAACLYVVRWILVYGWEAYEDEPNVILSRETQKWSRELVGSISLPDADAEGLRARIERLIACAVVGASRLPVSSWEAPLPAYALGQLAYLPDCSAEELAESSAPHDDVQNLLQHAAADGAESIQSAKALEAALRASPADDAPRVAQQLVTLVGSQGAESLVFTIRTLFHHLALTPYTAFEVRFARLLQGLAAPQALGPEAVIDLVSYQLRLLGRHLTAFDLRTFHHAGADYPDLLLLDALLKLYLELLAERPAAFLAVGDEAAGRAARLRRRALRQAWCLRTGYEGLRVPATPTSPGENQRVLPPPFERVSEEELAQPSRRRKELFAGDALQTPTSGPLAEALELAVADLEHPAERRELGLALFLDRPLGIGKRRGEVDRTPLLTYLAHSRFVARRRLSEIKRLALAAEPARWEVWEQAIRDTGVSGYPASEIPEPESSGVATLEDARRAAPDFFFLRTTRSSLDAFLASYDFTTLRSLAPETGQWLATARDVLLIRAAGPGLAAFDKHMTLRAQFALAGPGGTLRYVESDGREWLADGWRLLKLRAADELLDFHDKDIVLPPNFEEKP